MFKIKNCNLKKEEIEEIRDFLQEVEDNVSEIVIHDDPKEFYNIGIIIHGDPLNYDQIYLPLLEATDRLKDNYNIDIETECVYPRQDDGSYLKSYRINIKNIPEKLESNFKPKVGGYQIYNIWISMCPKKGYLKRRVKNLFKFEEFKLSTQ